MAVTHSGHAAAWPVLGLLANATVWGLSWWPFRALQAAGLHPLWTTAAVCVFGAVVVAALHPAGLRALARSRALWAIGLASGMTNACFNTAVTYGEVVRVVLLFYLMPVWAVLLARRLLGEAVTAAALARVALALAGAVLVLHRPEGGLPLPSSLADALAVAGGFFFALNNVLIARTREETGMARALAMFVGAVTVGAVSATILSVAGAMAWPAIGGVAAAAILALTGLAFVLSNLGLQYGASRLPANVTAVVMLTEVVVAAASAWLVAGETPTARQLAGGALIVLATLLAALGGRARSMRGRGGTPLTP